MYNSVKEKKMRSQQTQNTRLSKKVAQISLYFSTGNF